MAQEIFAEVRAMWKRRYFAVALPLMAVISFCTLLTNPTVGIDDTAFDMYFEQGVAPAAGRWCLFLINKVFALSYNPYFMEAVGLALFCVSVSLWCVVFDRVFGTKIPDYGYLLFGCVMISSPITSEVIVYYLHNGIFLAYGMCALAILIGMKLFRTGCSYKRGQKIKYLLLSVLCLTIALGCYESFMIVFLMGMVMVYLSVRIAGGKKYCEKAIPWAVYVVLAAVCALLFRTLIVKAMIAGFGLQEETKVLNSRGLHEFLGWFDGTRSVSDFAYVMKDFFVKYYINGVVYLPITILVLAIGILLLFAIVLSVKKKDGLIVAAAVGIVLLPWLMPVLEGSATFYRSCQYIPLLTAFSVLLVSRYAAVLIADASSRRRKLIKYTAAFLAGMLLYAQAYEMNRWLYLDALKYEDTKRTLDAVAYSILQCENPGKPVCIVGKYEVPVSLAEEAVCPSWSKKYVIVEALVKKLDEDIWEKYGTDTGYVFAETPELSFLEWGATAFYGFDRQIIRFWEMHGYTFTEDNNLTHYVEAREEMKDGPVFPEAGSVVEKEDYIIVNLR